MANRHKSEFLGEHVPRAADAAQRHHRLQRDAAGGGAATSARRRFVPDLKKINAAGKHLLELINAVLDLSKIEAGRMDLYLETFSVPTLVGEIAAVIQPLADKNGNRVEVRCDPAVGEMRADLTKVRQALFNLLSNACKFTERGTVSLAVRPEASDGRGVVVLRRERHRHRHDRGAARAPVPGVLPGRGRPPAAATAGRAWAWR